MTRGSGGYSDNVDPAATEKFQRPGMRDGIVELCSGECGSQRNASPNENVCLSGDSEQQDGMDE